MNKRNAIAVGVLAVMGGIWLYFWIAGQFGIEGIMKEGFEKGTLLDKIKKNEATPDELNRFADCCRRLCDLRPAKGDPASWKAKTTTLHTAAASLAAGDASARKAVIEAASCMGCHSAHK